MAGERTGGRRASIVFLAAVLIGGTAVVTRAAWGNGVREAPEECDGSELGPYTWGSLYGEAGTLRCAADPTFDLSDARCVATAGASPPRPETARTSAP